jgi:hypothetical protein
MTPSNWIEIIAALSIPAALIAVIVERTISKKGIGVRTIQFLGVATFVPLILILALERILDGNVISALVGAFVGYLFSRIADFENRGNGD